MRALLGLAVLAALWSPAASAIERYNADKLSCAEIRAIIDEDGAAIMRNRSKNNPTLILYDRFVRDRFFCTWREAAVPAWIASKDKPSCRVLRCDTPILPRRDILHMRPPFDQ